MRLTEFLPRNNQEKGDAYIQEFLRNIIIRANFVPAIRYHLGWRGVKEIANGLEGWTMKIDGYAGVFGLLLMESENAAAAVEGRYLVTYFPDPEEDIVESIPVPAGIITQRDDYLEKVRSFTAHQEMVELFGIGTILLQVHGKGKWSSLVMETRDRLKTLNEQGLYVTIDGDRKEVVAPGELEQDVPALPLVRSLYEVLAGSLSLILEQPPSRYAVYSGAGLLKVISSDGSLKELEDRDTRRWEFHLTWGEAYPDLPGKNLELLWEGEKEHPVPEARWWNAHRLRDASSMDKKILGIDDRPELIVLSGFLGSGKTTFLNHFVEYQQQFNRFTAVIQNELGEEGVDNHLLESDYAVMELDEGCVCCSLAGNLKSGISRMLDEFHPDYIILETTGVANPANLLDEVIELRDLVRFDSVTVIVDALNIEASLKAFSVSRDQLHTADIIILNKTESMANGEIDRLKNVIREHNPHAPIIPASYGEVNPGLLYSSDRDIPLEHGPGDHHHTHDMDGLESVTLKPGNPLGRDSLVKTLENLSPSVFRVKGLVELEEEGGVLVQYVSGRYEISIHEGTIREPFLTVIGRNLREELDSDSLLQLQSAGRS